MGVRKDYRTKDLNFAAFLKASGVEMTDAQRRGGEVYFVFANDERWDMRDMRNGYFSGKAEVSALDLFDARRSLKSLIHEV